MGSIRAGGRLIARATAKLAVDKSSLGQHLQERPFPHGAGDSVRPGAQSSHFLWGNVVLQHDVSHKQASSALEDPECLG